MGNLIVHFEIGCRDRAALQTFYTRLFDWRAETQPHGVSLRTGHDVGGHLTSLGHEPHNYTIFYVQVDDIDACIRKTESLDGKKIVGPITVPGSADRFAWIADPEGNMIGLHEKEKDQAKNS